MTPDEATDLEHEADAHGLTVALEEAVSARDWYRAVEIGERLLALWPGAAEVIEHTTTAHRAFALHAEQTGDLATALREWTRCLELSPTLALQWFNRGLIQRKLRQIDSAIADFTRAIEIDDTDPVFYSQRGHCHGDRRDHAAALADYTRAIELQSDDPEVHDARGVMYLNLHRTELGLPDWTRVIELKPSPRAYEFRAAAHIAAGNYAAAIADCLRGIDLEPAWDCFYRLLGVAYREGGDPARAVVECSRAIGLDPEDPINYWSRALALEALGDFKAAQRDRHLASPLEKRTS